MGKKILNDLDVEIMRCVDRIDWVAKKIPFEHVSGERTSGLE